MSPLPRMATGPWPIDATATVERGAARVGEWRQPPLKPAQAKVDVAEARQLARHCMRFRDPVDAMAWRELFVSLAFYAFACAALVAALSAGYWSGLLLAVPAGMAVVRIFTIQHDCGHGSFFSSRENNTWVGRALGVLTFTPYDAWRRAHTVHHAGSGDLTRRGIGDVDVLTLAEYRERSAWQRFTYRLYRNPLVLHVIGPPVYFLLLARWPWAQQLPVRGVWKSIMGTNLAILALYGTLVLAVGPLVGLAAVFAVGSVASWVGGWLFYVQHQFEETHWDDADEWQLQVAALNGSSHYVLPRWANWMTGNIALHHIHHLNARIPSYRLPECMDASPRLTSLSRLGFIESLRCVGLGLWDEGERRLIGFRAAHARLAA